MAWNLPSILKEVKTIDTGEKLNITNHQMMGSDSEGSLDPLGSHRQYCQGGLDANSDFGTEKRAQLVLKEMSTSLAG